MRHWMFTALLVLAPAAWSSPELGANDDFVYAMAQGAPLVIPIARSVHAKTDSPKIPANVSEESASLSTQSGELTVGQRLEIAGMTFGLFLAACIFVGSWFKIMTT